MELHLTVFFALTFLALAGNAVVLWVISKALRRAGERADANRKQYVALKSTLRQSLEAIEQTTAGLTIRSREVRDAVARVDSELGRADNWARYGLAKLDFNSDRVADRLKSKTRRLAREIRDPLFKTSVALHGVMAILELMARRERAQPEPGTRAARALAPLETVVTILDAVTAVGALFAPRDESGEIDPAPAEPFR